MTALRKPDLLDTGPRFTPAEASALDARLSRLDTADAMRVLLVEKAAGEIALVSSFGAESAVLLHLVAESAPGTPVLFLDTGKHFPETLQYRDDLVDRLGLTDVRVLAPDPADLAERDDSGLRWSYDPDGCCELRKVRPLARALAGFDATITGRKAFQAKSRAALPFAEIDRADAQGRMKINPLIRWDAARIADYVACHELPPHPLVAQGFPSIGCSPCTAKVKPGEDPRSGRWKGFEKTECGIHDFVI